MVTFGFPQPAPAMFEPIAFDRVESTLTTPAGWLELVITLACFLAGWLTDRYFERRGDAHLTPLRLPGGVVRFAMPIIAFLLLIVARAVWKRYLPPLFLDVGLLLSVALAVIRMIVYTLRRLVPNAAWLKGSERTVAFGVWTLVALHALGITPYLAAEMDAVRLPLGAGVTLLSVVEGLLAVLITLTLALWLSGLIEQRLMRTPLDLSQRALAARFVRAVLLVIGVLIAFQAIGFDLTLLSVFGGALGVGIGLGLQKLASNYIAGFVILLDRSIRLGDLVTVDNRHGVVTEVTSRYVVVRGHDGNRAIVPNETLVTTTVITHALGNRDLRVAIPITVSYASDVDRALALMTEVAAKHPRVRTDAGRQPAAFVVRFAELGIELELGIWIDDPGKGHGDVRSDVSRAVWSAFRAEGIGVPVRTQNVQVLGPVESEGTGGQRAGASPPGDRDRPESPPPASD
jgi:small-conductance mechanosensitive channel